MLQYNYTEIMYSKNAKAGMNDEQRRNEETGVGFGGFLEVIFEQVSRMLSLPGRKVGETTF